MCQTGFDSRCLRVLALIAVEELLILVDRARDDVEVEPLGRLRLAIHEQRQAFGRGIAQPFVDGEAVALRLGNLLALLVEEQLVVEAFRRLAAERAADFAGQLDRIDQVLAGHLVVDAERDPAHGPVRLPLQLAAPAGDRRGHRLLGVGVFVGDGAGLGVVRDDRHLQHDAGLRDRSAGTANRCAARSSRKRRQHDRHHLVEALQHLEQRVVEAAGRVAVGRRHEFVVEAEMIEEGAQPRIVVLRRSSDACRTDRAPWSAACRDAAPASPCSARCPAPCAGRPCRRRRRSAAS